MNGGSPRIATLKPLISPITAPMAIPPRTPSGSGSPASVSRSPVTTEHKVIAVPSDRSMPPVMITNVVPTARMPMTAVDSRIELRFEIVRNRGLAMKKMRIRAMSVPKASICWSPWPSEANRPVRPAAAATVSPGGDWLWASARSSVSR